MRKNSEAIRKVFKDPMVATKIVLITRKETIQEHLQNEFGNRLKSFTTINDEEYDRLFEKIQEHFFDKATSYCREHPETNMIQATQLVMTQEEVFKVAERYVMAAAPVKGVKSFVKSARNFASKSYETVFPERDFDKDVEEFKEELKESGQEVKKELKKVAVDAKEAFNDFKDKHSGDEKKTQSPQDTEEESVSENNEEP